MKIEKFNVVELNASELEDIEGGTFFVGFCIGLGVFALGCLLYNLFD